MLVVRYKSETVQSYLVLTPWLICLTFFVKIIRIYSSLFVFEVRTFVD